MSYVILQPHLATNPSAHHRVVEYAAWKAHADSRCTTPLPVLFEGNAAAARADCDARNAALVTTDN